MGSSKTIAKNTVSLYLSMAVTMVVTLYMSRVILEKLGVDDYGIYQAVGGIVGFLAFLNGALSTGTSRFLTFELGAGSFESLKKTFSTLLTTHLILGIIILILAETLGLWFVNNKMVIAPERMDAGIFTYHISILTAMVTLILVPFSASIIAHEKMGVYSILNVFDAFLRLGICYMIGMGDFDKLQMYAFLLFVEQLLMLFFYAVYCSRKFPETKYKPRLDWEILKPVLSFSGWSLFAQGATAFSNQGILILLNMFFAPAVVTARAISLQVNSAANQFVNNFRAAVNPQIVKLYAVKDYEGSKKLLLQSTKTSFYLMLMISLPVFFLADPLLHLWLGQNVPEYTVVFLQIVIIQSLFQVFDTSFYSALYAKGRLKENALTSPLILYLAFPVIYSLFKAGCSPVALSWAYLVCFAIIGMIVKPILIVKIVDYKWKEIFAVFGSCLLVSIVSIIPSYFIDTAIDSTTILGFFIEAILIVLAVCIASFVIGVDKSMKKKIVNAIKSKIRPTI